MKIKIRNATTKDFQAILSLIKEHAIFSKSQEKVTNTVDQMQKDKALFKCLVAENQKNEIIGIAIYYITYSSWVGKSIYLDDLYIKKEFREKGIGSAFMNRIIETAKKTNCNRIRWHVLKWNKAAIDFYKKQGAITAEEDLITYDLTKKEIVIRFL